MSHAAYAWVLEVYLVALKRPAVYLELGAYGPKCFAAPGCKWDPFLQFGRMTIAEKIRGRNRRISDQPALGNAVDVGWVLTTYLAP